MSATDLSVKSIRYPSASKTAAALTATIFTGELIAAAKANGIDYAADVYPHYGSDVEATLRGGADARHALIGAGVYASHGYERSHVDGVKNTLELLAAYLDK